MRDKNNDKHKFFRDLNFSDPNIITRIILAILIILFFASSPKTEKSFQSALLNPKYDIDRISLFYQKEGRVNISRHGGFWLCDYEGADGKKAVFPCDTSQVEKLLNNARKIIKLYEISYNLKAKSAFSLDENEAFCMEFFSGEKTASKIYFGAMDARRRIALYAEGQKKIYSTDSGILSFLNCSADFWCDPLIFPESVCGDISNSVAKLIEGGTSVELNSQKISRLRHGRLFFAAVPDTASTNASTAIEVDDGKGNIYRAAFFPMNDNDENIEQGFFCRFEAIPSIARNEAEKAAVKSLDYVTTISAWTLSQAR